MNIRYTTFLSYATMVVFAMFLTVISPLLPEIAATYSLDLTRSGFIFTANFIGFVIFILIGGILADRIGKRPVLIGTLAVFTGGMLSLPLASNFTAACLVMAVLGGCGGILESQIGSLISDINPANTGFYVNLTQIFFGIGAIGGPLFAAVFVSRGYGWRLVYVVLSGLTALLTIGFLFTRIPRKIQDDPISWRGLRSLISAPRFLLICLCMILYTGSEVGGWGWLSTFLKQDLGFTVSQSSMAVGVFWVAMTLGRFGCGPFILRFPTRFIIIGLALLATLATLLTGLLTPNWAVWCVIFLMGLAYSSQWPLIVAYGGNQYPAFSGTVYALLVGCGGIGGTTVPYLMGALGQHTNIRLAMVSPAVLFLLVALIFWRIERVPLGRQTEIGK